MKIHVHSKQCIIQHSQAIYHSCCSVSTHRMAPPHRYASFLSIPNHDHHLTKINRCNTVTVHVQNDAPATRCELSLYYKKKTRQDHDTPWSANKNLIQIRSGTTIHHSTEFTSALPMLEAGKCAPWRAQSTRRLQPTTTPADPMRRGHFGAKKTGDGAKDSCWCVLLHPFSRQQQCYNCWSGSSGVGAGS